MKRLIISLVVLVVLTVMAIPTFGKGGSNLKIIDANGLFLWKAVGTDAGAFAQLATTVGGEIVILQVSRNSLMAAGVVQFREDDCDGQGFITNVTSSLTLTGVGGVNNSVYKVLDRDAALEEFTVESLLAFGGCFDVSFFANNLLPATFLGDLGEFTPPFEFF